MNTPELTQLIAETLHSKQKTMPDGQSFNLYSYSACFILASEIIKTLQSNLSHDQNHSN